MVQNKPGFVNVFEHVEIADSSRVDFREHLHKYKGVEDEPVQLERSVVAIFVAVDNRAFDAHDGSPGEHQRDAHDELVRAHPDNVSPHLFIHQRSRSTERLSVHQAI